MVNSAEHIETLNEIIVVKESIGRPSLAGDETRGGRPADEESTCSRPGKQRNLREERVSLRPGARCEKLWWSIGIRKEPPRRGPHGKEADCDATEETHT